MGGCKPENIINVLKAGAIRLSRCADAVGFVQRAKEKYDQLEREGQKRVNNVLQMTKNWVEHFSFPKKGKSGLAKCPTFIGLFPSNIMP